MTGQTVVGVIDPSQRPRQLLRHAHGASWTLMAKPEREGGWGGGNLEIKAASLDVETKTQRAQTQTGPQSAPVSLQECDILTVCPQPSAGLQ